MDRNQLRKILKEYFTFSRGDRIAIFVLLFVLFVFIIATILIGRIKPRTVTDFTALKNEISRWENATNGTNEVKRRLFPFDPNTISSDEMDSLDMPYQVKKNLLKYRESGGYFRKATDLRKIYGMNDSVFGIISGYIVIADSGNGKEPGKIESRRSTWLPKQVGNETFPEKEVKPEYPEKAPVRVEIEMNSADSVVLVSAKGIGPVLASRIIKYRNMLGGFYSVDQLAEVYGISHDTWLAVRDQFVVDTTLIKRIRINFSDYRGLIRHPYFTKNQVNSLLKYRTRNGPIRSGEVLLLNSLVDTATYDRVLPYLSFD